MQKNLNSSVEEALENTPGVSFDGSGRYGLSDIPSVASPATASKCWSMARKSTASSALARSKTPGDNTWTSTTSNNWKSSKGRFPRCTARMPSAAWSASSAKPRMTTCKTASASAAPLQPIQRQKSRHHRRRGDRRRTRRTMGRPHQLHLQPRTRNPKPWWSRHRWRRAHYARPAARPQPQRRRQTALQTQRRPHHHLCCQRLSGTSRHQRPEQPRQQHEPLPLRRLPGQRQTAAHRR